MIVRKTPSSQKRSRAASRYEETFALHARAAGIDSGMVREYVFHPTRKWRADFAWPELRLLVEIDGGIWMPKSGHSGGRAAIRDRERDNAAVLLGLRVLRFTGAMVQSGEAIQMVERIMKNGNVS